MNQTLILAEVKKAIDLWMDKTYNESEFYSHIMQIVKDNCEPSEAHKDQLERLMFKMEELRENQRMYHGGHKGLLGTCRTQEVEIDRKIMAMKTMKGYSTERFKPKAVQENMFK